MIDNKTIISDSKESRELTSKPEELDLLIGRLEEMILHAAFLVQREHTLLFLADAENLKSEHPWWQVECTGAWAPYNFLAAHEEMQSV